MSDLELIGVTIEGWMPGIAYLWNNGETDSAIYVHPEVSTVYTISVSHPAYSTISVKTFHVDVNNPPILVSDEQKNIPNTVCPGTAFEIEVFPTGGLGNYNYAWSSGANTNPAIVHPENSKLFTVTITDVCNTKAFADVLVTMEAQNPLISPDKIKVDFTCENNQITLSPDLNIVSGGIGFGYTFSFDPQQFTNTPLTVLPKNEATYLAFVTDACKSQINTISINLNQLDPFIPTLVDDVICSGDSVLLAKNDSAGSLYFWESGQLYAEFSKPFEKSSTVEVIFFDECGTQHTLLKNIIINDANANFDYKTRISSNIVKLEAESKEAESYTWTINGKQVSLLPEIDILLTPGENIVTLTTTNETGCTSSITRNIVLRDGVDAPTAFSPNGDGINDVFTIRFDEELIEFQIEIYNRWGQLIYKSNDQYFTWDGIEGNPNGQLNTFAYKIKGLSSQGEHFYKNATITLVRTK